MKLVHDKVHYNTRFCCKYHVRVAIKIEIDAAREVHSGRQFFIQPSLTNAVNKSV